jgi:ATP-binding cassette subfamily A (ABC1) protein 3
MSTSAKTAACLLSPTCVGIGASILAMFESSGEGLTFANLSRDPTDGDSFTMASVFGMLVLDCIIYGLIAWYVEAVYPGANGIPHKPWFFLTRKYWFQGHPDSTALISGDELVNTGFDESNYERDPAGVRAGIQLRNLRKVFKGVGGQKVAVDNLNLNILEGQITVLLGHNGAGKTTTMSMLVGMFPPTSGSASINGYDVVTELDAARSSLGLCPQFDILFDLLTVEEHLYFFSKLKGVGDKDIKKEIDTFVKDLDLEPKRFSQSQTLSGGQKRALSVGVALVGGSRVVILDEPTSGMDPYKRRHTWYAA